MNKLLYIKTNLHIGLFVLITFFAVQSGLADKEYQQQIDELEARVTELEQQLKDKVTELDQKITEVESKAAAANAKNSALENKARQLLNEISSLATNGKVDDAKGKIVEFKKLYSTTESNT